MHLQQGLLLRFAVHESLDQGLKFVKFFPFFTLRFSDREGDRRLRVYEEAPGFRPGSLALVCTFQGYLEVNQAFRADNDK